MKAWTSFGSAHSARLSVVGEFEKVESAELAERVVEDFVNAAWGERYPSIVEFLHAWKDRLSGVEFLGPDESDFDLGLDNSCDVARIGTAVSVTRISGHRIDGIVKLMLLADPKEIRISGRTGP